MHRSGASAVLLALALCPGPASAAEFSAVDSSGGAPAFSSRHDFAAIERVPERLWEAAMAFDLGRAAVADRFVTESELAAAAGSLVGCVEREAAIDGVSVSYRHGTVSLQIADPPAPARDDAVSRAEWVCFERLFEPLADIARIIHAPTDAELAEIRSKVGDCESAPQAVPYSCSRRVLGAFAEHVESQWRARVRE